MAGNAPVNSFLLSVRAQLAAAPTRTHSPLPPKSDFWHWVRAALAFRPIYAQNSSHLIRADSRVILTSIQQIIDSPAVQRLHHRHAINKLADFLAHPGDTAVAKAFVRANEFARANARDLDRARAFDIADTLKTATASHLGNVSNLDADLVESLRLAVVNALDLANALDLLSRIDPIDGAEDRRFLKPVSSDYREAFARANSLDRDLASALDTARALLQDYRYRDTSGVLADALNRSNALARASDLDHHLVDALDSVWISAQNGYVASTEITSMIENLQHAANGFSGADLRQARLDVVDLSWLRWDKNTTQWPEAWAERIHSASIEQPKGSGQCIILPAFDNDPATFPTTTL